MTGRSSIAAPLLAAIAILLVPLAAYVAGYFWLGSRLDVPSQPSEYSVRVYSADWQATAFRPLAAVESFLSGTDVEVIAMPPSEAWQSYPPLPP